MVVRVAEVRVGGMRDFDAAFFLRLCLFTFRVF